MILSFISHTKYKKEGMAKDFCAVMHISEHSWNKTTEKGRVG